ncbi:MAG: hypothetical protein HZA49_10615 [Planctomycetes bacterium]|nr:hypothetical protein [Planctomycetota bacterium]
MLKIEKWGMAGAIVMILASIILSVAINGCFKHSTDEPISGSSVPAPGAFTLGTPGDMTVGIDLSGSISGTGLPMTWTPSTDVANYLLEISKDDSFAAGYSVYSPTFASNVTQILLVTTTLTSNTLYYWRVKATNASGTLVASNVPFSFYTGSGAFAPGSFDLQSPQNLPGNVSQLSPNSESLTPTLTWTNAATETLYTVYLDDDTSVTDTPIYSTTTKPGVWTASIPASANLTDTARYYWTVVATGNISATAATTPYYSFVTGPIKYYAYTTITPTVITAGESISATLKAYDNNTVTVTTHTPFSITMTSSPGVTFYTDNTLGTPTTTYTLTGGTADIYLAITTSGSAVITATDIAGRSVSSTATTITVNPAALDHYYVVPASYSIVSGTAISVTITAQDVYSNTVTSASTEITMTINATSGTPAVAFYETGIWDGEPVAFSNPWASGVAQLSMKAEVSGATDEKFTIRAEDVAAKYGTSGEVTVGP